MSDSNTVEAPTIQTVQDIDAAIQERLENESDASLARGWSKKSGFNAVSVLAASSVDVLVGMAGAIMYALANKAAEGDENAPVGLNLIADYAGSAADSAGELRAAAERIASLNARFDTICNTVRTLSGMSHEEFDALEETDRLNRVIEFLNNNNGQVTQSDLVAYVESRLETVSD